MTGRRLPPVYTAREAADVVTAQIDRLREPLRVEASRTNAIEYPRRRIELVEQVDLLNRLDELVRRALGAPSRVGPPRPALRDVPDEPAGFPISPAYPSPAHRSFRDGARWTPDLSEGR